MKFGSLIAVVAFAGVLASTSAQACVAGPDCVNFSGLDVNMNNVFVGEQGTITENLDLLSYIPGSAVGISLAYGNIPDNSEILFSYSFTGLENNLSNALNSGASYTFLWHGKTFAGFSNGDSQVVSGPFGPDVANQAGSINGSSVGIAGIPLIYATANLNNNTMTGKSSITSYARGLQGFTTSLVAFFHSAPPGTATIQYRVIGMPLPASLPMMLLAIGGLFGFARVSKQRKAIAIA